MDRESDIRSHTRLGGVMTRQRFVTYAVTFAIAGLPLSGVAWAQDRTSNGNTTGSAVPRGDGGGSAAPRGDGGGSSAGSVGGSSSSGSSGDAGGMSSGWSSPSSGSSSTPVMGSSFDAPRRSSDQATRSRSGGNSTGIRGASRRHVDAQRWRHLGPSGIVRFERLRDHRDGPSRRTAARATADR